MLIYQYHSNEPAEAFGLPAAHGLPKLHGPWDHCLPLPPLSAPLHAVWRLPPNLQHEIVKCMQYGVSTFSSYQQSSSHLNQGLDISIAIDNRYYVLCFSAIDYRRCFAFNFFYRLSPFLCFLLTRYRLIESLYLLLFSLSLPKLTSFRFSYSILLFIILKVYFLYSL